MASPCGSVERKGDRADSLSPFGDSCPMMFKPATDGLHSRHMGGPQRRNEFSYSVDPSAGSSAGMSMSAGAPVSVSAGAPTSVPVSVGLVASSAGQPINKHKLSNSINAPNFFIRLPFVFIKELHIERQDHTVLFWSISLILQGSGLFPGLSGSPATLLGPRLFIAGSGLVRQQWAAGKNDAAADVVYPLPSAVAEPESRPVPPSGVLAIGRPLRRCGVQSPYGVIQFLAT
jgi:hypothetical protein